MDWMSKQDIGTIAEHCKHCEQLEKEVKVLGEDEDIKAEMAQLELRIVEKENRIRQLHKELTEQKKTLTRSQQSKEKPRGGHNSRREEALDRGREER